MIKHHFVVAVSVIGFAAFCASAQAHETINHPVSPQQNIVNSMRYEHMLHTNSAFLATRQRKECGPLRNDPGLWEDCVASFTSGE